LPHCCWPVDEIIQTLEITKARRLSRIEALVFALTSVASALTGSCASDLFRTAALQRFPFPTDYGRAGDGAWGIQNALNMVWAVVPGHFSKFIQHPNSATSAERFRYVNAPRLDLVARQTVSSGLQSGLISATEIERFGIEDLLKSLSEFLEAKEFFDRKRRNSFPWVLWPTAWQARRHRNHSHTRMCALRTRALRLAEESLSPVAIPAARGPAE
jgi:hypothetical protein